MGSHVGKPKQQKLAEAGAILAANPGKPLKDALTTVGYSETTARVPKANGLSAERCLEAAQKAGLVPTSAKIRDQARRLIKAKLDDLLNDPKMRSKSRAGEVARIVEVAEKYHGEAIGEKAETPRQFVDRVAFMAGVIDEMQRRGLVSIPLSPETIEAKSSGDNG